MSLLATRFRVALKRERYKSRAARKKSSRKFSIALEADIKLVSKRPLRRFHLRIGHNLAPKGTKRESKLINYESCFSIQRIDRAVYVPRNRPGLVPLSRFLPPPSRENFSRLIIRRPGKNTTSSGRP
jgi:hypothetical protein